MPQTFAEKKFFGKIITKIPFDIRSLVFESLGISSFQKYKGFQKNITGGKG